MRILVHDFAGHPFQIQLSRALARSGHIVLHAYCGSLQTTPRGSLTQRPDDPDSLTISSITLDEPLDKYALIKRWHQEQTYGRLLARTTATFHPQVVLSANTPLDAQRVLLKTCRASHTRFVFWLQDLIGLAAHRLLRRKIPLAGTWIGRYYLHLERRLLKQSDAVIAITEDFVPILHRYGVPEERLHVIENWALLDETPVLDKDNAWARQHRLADKKCLLYSGTLGMKHNPDLLLRLALHFRNRPEVRVVVVSQGLGADWLQQQRETHNLDNLVLLPYQPFERLPEVLATADVLVAILELEAGVFSVPSKVLTYLCAARPLLLAVPPENLAARTVQRHDAGRVVPPTDADAFIHEADALLDDPALPTRLGRNARAYAEQTFDLDAITARFEAILCR